MERNELVQRVKEIIVKVLNLDIQPAEIADDELLLGGGLEVDSLAVLQIVDELEVVFSVTARDEEVTADLFRSVATLTDFVERKLAEAGEREQVKG